MQKLKKRVSDAAIEHRSNTRTYKQDWKKNKSLYMWVIPIIIWYLVFQYYTMYGVVVGFKDYRIGKGILGSEWVGLKHVVDFFNYPEVVRLFTNALRINLVGYLFWPFGIGFALMLNELRYVKVRRVAQTISIFPHFVSAVVTCTVIREFCMTGGLFNEILSKFGVKPVNLLTVPDAFVWILQIKNQWAGLGWGAINFLAIMASVDKSLYEAAEMDGAGRLRRMWSITLPSIAPMVTMSLVMSAGGLFSSATEDILLLYNPTIYETADVVGTFMFRTVIEKQDFSYGAGVGIFNSIVSFVFVRFADEIAKKISDYNVL